MNAQVMLPRDLRPATFCELAEGSVFWQNCGCKWRADRLVQEPLHLEATIVKNCHLHRNRNAKARILGRTQLWVSAIPGLVRRAWVKRLIGTSTTILALSGSHSRDTLSASSKG
jgi:hypothetical protein